MSNSISNRQQSAIDFIEVTLGIRFKGYSRKDASRFIGAYLDYAKESKEEEEEYIFASSVDYDKHW